MAERVQILQSIAGERERLNSLGTMAAGLAHELNNPTAASRRAVEELQRAHRTVRASSRQRLGRRLEPEQLGAIFEIEASARAAAAEPPDLDPWPAPTWRTRSRPGWRNAAWKTPGTSPRRSSGAASTCRWLESVADAVSAEALPDTLAFLDAAVSTAGLLVEARQATTRVSDLVEAMKAYSNMDRAPLQEVDVNEAIESTLTVLGYELEGVEVARDFDPSLPRVMAYEGELNQVWTALVDNAIDAARQPATEAAACGFARPARATGFSSRSRTTVPAYPRRFRAASSSRSSPPRTSASGTGLGLDASYRIVVGRHGGDIRVLSEPGDTRFQVRLPMEGPATGGEPMDVEWTMEAGR